MPVQPYVPIGQSIAGYVVEALIGRGGMGEVYRARDERLGRPVALKLLLRTFADDDDFRERMLRESRLAASLDHPNVIPIYEAGDADGRLFIAMRYVDGTDLKALLRREGALQPARAVAIASQVADALDAAHAQGLVHRDVKPSNVLLDQVGGREHAYLADFGLTQSASDSQPTDGSLMGSVDYVAPEQIRGDEIDGRADVYALGCLLFETLTGFLPFVGSSEVAVVYAHLQDDPPRASARRPGLAPEVDAVLARALAKDPDERQSSANELVAALREALGLDAGPSSRRLLVLLAAILAVLVVGTAAAATILNRGGEGSSVPHGMIVGIDPVGNEVSAAFPVSTHPSALTVSRERIWAGDFRDGSLWRIDPASGDSERFTTTGEPRDLSATADKVYVASDGETAFDGTVARYDAVTGARETGVSVLSCSIVAGQGVAWVAGCPYLVRLSTGPGRLRIIKSVFVPFQQPRKAETSRNAMHDMALGEGALWVIGDPADRRLFKVDPTSGAILTITRLAFAPRSVAAGEDGVWVTGSIDDVVTRVDPVTARVTDTVHVPAGASGVGAGLGGVWVASALDRSISRIDPHSLQLVKTIAVNGAPHEIAIGAGKVWATVDAE